MDLFLKYLCDLENVFPEGKNAKNEQGTYFELFVVHVHNASPEITVHLPFGGEKKQFVICTAFQNQIQIIPPFGVNEQQIGLKNEIQVSSW